MGSTIFLIVALKSGMRRLVRGSPLTQRFCQADAAAAARWHYSRPLPPRSPLYWPAQRRPLRCPPCSPTTRWTWAAWATSNCPPPSLAAPSLPQSPTVLCFLPALHSNLVSSNGHPHSFATVIVDLHEQSLRHHPHGSDRALAHFLSCETSPQNCNSGNAHGLRGH